MQSFIWDELSNKEATNNNNNDEKNKIGMLKIPFQLIIIVQELNSINNFIGFYCSTKSMQRQAHVK